jgi:hypothetical protein
MASKHNYFRPTCAQLRPRAMFHQPKATLSRYEAREMVQKAESLDEFADSLAERLGPEANLALAQAVIARNLKRRR